jgi:CheY-like chemotaxis protein
MDEFFICISGKLAGTSRMKILIADDNRNTRKLMRSILKPFGHEICESQDGLDAVRLYDSEQPDIVLMDYEMKGMDGIRATEIIRASYPEARVIIITMFDDADIKVASLRAGAENFLLKENLTELPALLRE